MSIGILSFILALGLAMTMDTYRGYNRRSEAEVVVSVLQKARSRAMANIGESAWGVCYVSPNYVVFAGGSCAPAAATSELVAASPAAIISGLSSTTPIVFSQLSGTTSPASVSINQSGTTTVISINYEGTISW